MCSFGCYGPRAAALRESPDWLLLLSETGFLRTSGSMSYPRLFPEQGLQQCGRNAGARTSGCLQVFQSSTHLPCSYPVSISGSGLRTWHKSSQKFIHCQGNLAPLWDGTDFIFHMEKKSRILRKYFQKSESSKYFSTHSIITQVIIKVT